MSNPYPAGNKEAEAWLAGLREGVELAKARLRLYYDRREDEDGADWAYVDAELQRLEDE